MTTKKDFTKLPKKTTKKKNEDVKKGLSRLIKLMIDLNQGVLNLDHAAQECGVSRRTIQRDIETLEKAGLPLYKPNPQNVNYRVRDEFEWAKFNITKENALDFVDALDVLTDGLGKPRKWVLPIQKEVEKAGRKEQKKRQESQGKWEPMDATKENVMSIFLEDEKLKQAPLQILLALAQFNEVADDKGFRNSAYREWQERELQKLVIRFNWLGQQHREALKGCDKLIKNDPKDAWPYKQATLICYTKKDYKGALQYALDGFEQDKQDDTLLTYCIYFAILNKQYESAIRLFSVGISHKPLQTHFAALVYASVGQFDKALAIVEKAQKADPKNPKAYKHIKEQVLDLKAKKQ
ncbi:MAG: tetratricopeptide repeat protein [Elusimicrobiaceae bacterium]|nr:tetratricopeptide repeat protein [Elusimicrobiaceae bacterium]